MSFGIEPLIGLTDDVTLLESEVPDVGELTSGTTRGNGIFDVIFKAVKEHLKEEYNKGRLTGQDYANVLMGSITAVLQQSVAYAVSRFQKQKIITEILFLRQQIVTELVKTDSDVPHGLGFNNVPDGVSIAASGIMGATEAKTIADTSKSKSEKNLLTQKWVTEAAQIADNVPVSTHNWDAAPFYTQGGNINGVIGKQKILFTRQADGFLRDAEQKATKILMETWAVNKTIDEESVHVPSKADRTECDKYLNILLSGIGGTPSP